MTNINLSLPAEQLSKATQLASRLGLNRSSYLRRAIEAYNEKTEREILAQQFKVASEKCRDESLRVCREFESVDHVPE